MRLRLLLYALLLSFNLSAQRTGFFLSTVKPPTGSVPTNPNFTFTDDVDRGGGACEAVIRDGTNFTGHFTPPTGYTVTSWEIRRQTHSKNVTARGTGNTVSKTFNFVSMDSCAVYDLWATYTNGTDTYEYISPGEFFVLPAIPASYDATWSSATVRDGTWTNRTDYAINVTGSMSGSMNMYWWRADDPTDPIHIVGNAATITTSGTARSWKMTAMKNVIVDGCTQSDTPYGLKLVKSAGALDILFELQANETNDATHVSRNVWIVGVSANGGPSPSTGVTGMRLHSDSDNANDASNSSLDGIIVSNTEVKNTWEEGYYIGHSDDNNIGSNGPHPRFKGILFFHNRSENTGNEGFQISQQIPSTTTNPLIYKNEFYNAGTRNQEQHKNNTQFGAGNQGLDYFMNYSEGAHNAGYMRNNRSGGDNEYHANVWYSTGRDVTAGINFLISADNGDFADISLGFYNNTVHVARGEIFSMFHEAGVTFNKFYSVANLFISEDGSSEYEISGGTWDLPNEILFDNLITADPATFAFVDVDTKDYRPATTDGLAWGTYSSFTKASDYADYDFQGFKFTTGIAGAYSGTSTLIADGLPSVTYTITSVDASTPITVANGTAWPPATLPTQVTANLSDASTRSIDVSWAQGTYDGDVADTYTLTGTLTNLPSDVTNPSSYTGTIDVTVEEDEGGFDADYQAVLDRATTLGYTLPSSGDQILQNQLVLDLKAAGIWTKLDIFYVFATDGSSNYSLLNWKAPSSFQAALSGTAPTFTSNSGWAGNGFSSYLDLNWVPSTNGVQYTQNDAAVLVGVATNVSSNTDCEFGATQGGFTNRTTFNARTTSNTAFVAINGNNTTEIANATSVGNYIIQRRSSTDVRLFKGGSSIGTASLTSTGRPTAEMHLLEEMNVGNQSARRITHFGAGASLTGLESAFETAWTTYITGL